MSESESRRREPIVAIDGPSGSGKSTIAARLAQEFGYTMLDTGAIYRTVVLAARRAGVTLDDPTGLSRLAGELPLRFVWEQGVNRVLLGDEDVSDEIRRPEVSGEASRIAALPEVRAALLGLQRALAAEGGVVAEGRDIGTVVFPDAEVKFFLTADPEERARRRVLQLREAGQECDYEEILAGQLERDANDAQRTVAPLRQAEDAIPVDSTSMSLDEVVRTMGDAIRRARA